MKSRCSNLTIDTWTCAEHYGKCHYPELKADPDIVGIGVSFALASVEIACLVKPEKTYKPC